MCTDTPPSVKRPLFQFSLAELMVVVVAVGAGLLIYLRLIYGPIGASSIDDIALGSAIMLGISFTAACVGVFVSNYFSKAIERLIAPGPWGRIITLLLFVWGPWVLIIIVMFLMAIFSSGVISGRECIYETGAASCCRAFAAAEEIYHRTDYTGNGVLKYAPTLRELLKTAPLMSRWTIHTRKTGTIPMIDTTFAKAEGVPGVASPKYGYVFKVITAQGSHAPGGKMSYIDENGNMTKGFALVACPGAYDYTGRVMFMISKDGNLFRKDCGQNTPQIYNTMTEFDPDDTWVPTDENWMPSE